MPFLALAPLTLALAGCVAAPPSLPASSQPVFDPIAFFSGATRGDGRLKILFRSETRFTVRGRGQIAGDGSLVLDQAIERPGKPVQNRQWRIRRTAPGIYSATLSSADGPVAVAVEGNLLRLAFREKGVTIRQVIALAPDGRSALNRMSLAKFGVRVATIEENIRREGSR